MPVLRRRCLLLLMTFSNLVLFPAIAIQLQQSSIDFYLTKDDTLSIPNPFNYFNAGVLLVNLEKWRRDNIADQILDFVRDYPEKRLIGTRMP